MPQLNEGMPWRSGELGSSWKRNPLRDVNYVDTTCGSGTTPS